MYPAKLYQVIEFKNLNLFKYYIKSQVLFNNIKDCGKMHLDESRRALYREGQIYLALSNHRVVLFFIYAIVRPQRW